MPGFSSTKQALVVAALIAVVALAANYVLFQQIRSKSESIGQLSTEITAKRQQKQRLNAMESLVKQTKEKRARLDSYFVGSDAIVPFLEQLEGFGSSTGAEVAVDSVSRPQRDGDGPIEPLQLTLSAQGEWGDVYHLFRLLETLPYSVTVDRASLSAAGASTQQTATSSWSGLFVFEVSKLR
jgi:Tfp pilus assembly protein PilN